jgi:hypothetical protein
MPLEERNMSLQKLLTCLGILIWAAVALTAAPAAHSRRIVSSLLVSEESPVRDCTDLHVNRNGHQSVMQSEQRTITRAEASTLRVRASTNGGVQVEGGSGDSYAVTLCKFAEPGSGAENLLSQVHISFQNGELSVSGPHNNNDWSDMLLIRAPKAADMDLDVNNGPLSIREVNGTLKVHAENGPVTVHDCSGELDLRSHNGPVTLSGNSGKQNISTENGPVTLSLSGTTWNGSGLEAHAHNGPLTLKIPSNYQSGVILESEGHSPFQCHAAACSEGRKTWDDDRKRIEFGSGPTLVRLTTANGPVIVN